MDMRDWSQELIEFVRAAMVFKPMSRLMATRFTSSSTFLPGSTESDDTPIVSKPQKEPEDPAVAAARINMYGPITRTKTDFFPTRLLCKRFNIKDPHPNIAVEDENKEKEDHSLINAEAVKELKREARGAGTYDLAPIQLEESVEVQPDRNEILEGERAGEDIFKSIFGEDSDEE
jgi:G patch domain-containing protein 1